MDKNLSNQVNENVIRNNLQNFKDIELNKHYDFSVEAESLVEDATQFANFRISEDHELYY